MALLAAGRHRGPLRGRAGARPGLILGKAWQLRARGGGGFPNSSVICRRAGTSQPSSTHAATPRILLPASWLAGAWSCPLAPRPAHPGSGPNSRGGGALRWVPSRCSERQAALTSRAEVVNVGNSFRNDAAPGSRAPQAGDMGSDPVGPVCPRGRDALLKEGPSLGSGITNAPCPVLLLGAHTISNTSFPNRGNNVQRS